jgi:hypothetical protein
MVRFLERREYLELTAFIVKSTGFCGSEEYAVLRLNCLAVCVNVSTAMFNCLRWDRSDFTFLSSLIRRPIAIRDRDPSLCVDSLSFYSSFYCLFY